MLMLLAHRIEQLLRNNGGYLLTHMTQRGQTATCDVQIGRFVYRMRLTIVREVEERKVIPLPRPHKLHESTHVYGPGNC